MNAFPQAVFADLRHPPSRAHEHGKRAGGERHNRAVLCLLGRRVDVLRAMLTPNAPDPLPSGR